MSRTIIKQSAVALHELQQQSTGPFLPNSDACGGLRLRATRKLVAQWRDDNATFSSKGIFR